MLSPEQIAKRKGKLTGSKVRALMTGDAEAVLRLYREMIGEEQEEDLSHIWAVQLGSATEALNLSWYERKNKHELVGHGEVVVHPIHPWAAATLDGFDTVLNCPVEAKCVGGREPLETIIDRYQPQMQWQMECTSAKECALSVIMGANEPIVEYIARDAEYAAEMIRRGAAFMLCVGTRTPPVALDAVPPPADASKIYDMTGDNRWGNAAGTWLISKPAAIACADAEKELKSYVPADAKLCAGHGIRITRDRAGRLSLRALEE